MSTILGKGVKNNSRIISGNILTGKQTSMDGHLDYYSNTITAIPEGDDYDLFGWTRPIFDKISASRALTFSWLFPNKKFDLNTNTNGEHRAFVVTGSYEKVFPLETVATKTCPQLLKDQSPGSRVTVVALTASPQLVHLVAF